MIPQGNDVTMHAHHGQGSTKRMASDINDVVISASQTEIPVQPRPSWHHTKCSPNTLLLGPLIVNMGSSKKVEAGEQQHEAWAPNRSTQASNPLSNVGPVSFPPAMPDRADGTRMDLLLLLHHPTSKQQGTGKLSRSHTPRRRVSASLARRSRPRRRARRSGKTRAHQTRATLVRTTLSIRRSTIGRYGHVTQFKDLAESLCSIASANNKAYLLPQFNRPLDPPLPSRMRCSSTGAKPKVKGLSDWLQAWWGTS